jgi:hypothetical protein
LAFFVPPTREDPNIYSLHVSFRGSKEASWIGLTTADRVGRFATGMSNGIKGFSLGKENFGRLHERILIEYERMADVIRDTYGQVPFEKEDA